MPLHPRERRRERGLALISVLFFVLLMVATVATFLNRVGIDGLSSRGRDRSAQAEALARGGVQLAIGLLLEDRLLETDSIRVETRRDVWALAGREPMRFPDGGELRLAIEDAGGRLNLNALFVDGEPRDDLTEVFLSTFLEKVIAEVPATEEEADYDPLELARNLMDWMDADSERLEGGPEDAYYQDQQPSYRAANRPLLSVDELGLVEGFDPRLVNTIRPYVSVYPVAGADGINPNTAPTYVLAAIYSGGAGDYRLATEDLVRRIVEVRATGSILCDESANHPDCVPLAETIGGDVFPPPSFQSDVFHVQATATYGDVRRRVEAVVDRSDVEDPRILAWNLR
ncbi:MAG: type II secretion system minor pseudopilin GspK [Myxococcota bacterium]|nr:type II secretion system minor pseudopilin GspK [Myxococcota bacterium]